MEKMICSAKFGGCGLVADAKEFAVSGGRRKCPSCREYYAFVLRRTNFESVADKMNAEKAKAAMEETAAESVGEALALLKEKGVVSEFNPEAPRRRIK